MIWSHFELCKVLGTCQRLWFLRKGFSWLFLFGLGSLMTILFCQAMLRLGIAGLYYYFLSKWWYLLCVCVGGGVSSYRLIFSFLTFVKHLQMLNNIPSALYSDCDITYFSTTALRLGMKWKPREVVFLAWSQSEGSFCLWIKSASSHNRTSILVKIV